MSETKNGAGVQSNYFSPIKEQLNSLSSYVKLSHYVKWVKCALAIFQSRIISSHVHAMSCSSISINAWNSIYMALKSFIFFIIHQTERHFLKHKSPCIFFLTWESNHTKTKRSFFWTSPNDRYTHFELVLKIWSLYLILPFNSQSPR